MTIQKPDGIQMEFNSDSSSGLIPLSRTDRLSIELSRIYPWASKIRCLEMPSRNRTRVYIQAEIHSVYNIVHSAAIEIHEKCDIETAVDALKFGIDEAIKDIGAYE